jgi:hypothetical protein
MQQPVTFDFEQRLIMANRLIKLFIIKILKMKQRMLTIAFSLVMLLGSVAGNATGIHDQIINSFKKDFAAAQDAQWEQGKQFTKVTFKLNDQVMMAYYSTEGSLLGVTRNITSSQLPINLLTHIKKNYGAYWITDLFEIAMQNETSYYITLQNGDQTLILKSNAANGWEVYKKEKKESAL